MEATRGGLNPSGQTILTFPCRLHPQGHSDPWEEPEPCHEPHHVPGTQGAEGPGDAWARSFPGACGRRPSPRGPRRAASAHGVAGVTDAAGPVSPAPVFRFSPSFFVLIFSFHCFSAFYEFNFIRFRFLSFNSISIILFFYFFYLSP